MMFLAKRAMSSVVLKHKLENLKKYLPQTRFEELERRWKKLHGMVSFKGRSESV